MTTNGLSEQVQVEFRAEPLTYSPENQNSYFLDLVHAEVGDTGAISRLKRHSEEMRVEIPRREGVWRMMAAQQGLEYRANPDRSPGQGGYFAPPLWLIDRFATAPRPGRVLAGLTPSLALPQGVQSVSLPRLTTGTSTQTDEDLADTPGQDIIDAQVESAVVTIAGQSDPSLQVLEQSPPGAHLDWALFKDMTEAYDAELEAQMIAGTGTNGQLLGVIAVGGSIPYTSSSPSATEAFNILGKAIAYVGNNRLLPPETWLMRTARGAWIATGEDQRNRPLIISDISDTPGMFDLATYPARMDDAIPETFDANGNLGSGDEDRIILCRPSDMLLLESEPRTAVMLDPLSGTLQARLQLHRYVAALTGRYPTGIAVIGGTGLAVASGFST